MKREHRWIVLIWSIWTVQFLNAEAEDDDCTLELRVRRNTIYNTSLGQELRVECPVVFCNNSPPTICWSKVEEDHICLNENNNNHIKTEWKVLNPPEGTSYLIFQSIISSDSGGYQCKGGGSMSHLININVYDMAVNDTHKPTTNDTDDQSNTEPADRFLMYIYSAAGIGSFVFIVIIISVICMRGCKGKSRKEKQQENQYIEMPLGEGDVPNATGIQHSPRGSPNPLPPRRPSGRKTTAGQPAELTPSRDNPPPYGQRTRDRNRNGAQAEEAGSVVYAALNHAPPQREAPRPQRQIEETEYAAIRLV
ncbi:B- and T-lymphocyte attenuator-like [Poeciliopsis prolifica]|uniref:B- and T-lymphocyte attenuator-like n=1 Tax=Poeciliopsis prolifica TaxID=188132 RepID=UPI00241414CD|nr:B- and T-lymphocyte attenuator-like [Poeciliopsis prolifica]